MKYKLVNDENELGSIAIVKQYTQLLSDSSSAADTVGYAFKNQVIRIVTCTDDWAQVSAGSRYVWIALDDILVDSNDVTNAITESPAWFPGIVVITESVQVFDWASGKPFKEVAVGDEFQLFAQSAEFYTVIYTTLDSDDNEQNTLINVPTSAAKLQYRICVTTFSDTYFATKLQNDVVDFACSFVGCKYVWGGTDPNTGADCSGFVQYVFRHFGYELPRCSWEQACMGREVSLDELQPGDLIFYQRGEKIGHVTIYAGNGLCVQARGDRYGICITKFDYSVPLKAMRILGD